ncbi:glutamate decarboxylase gad1 [Entomophthora muscae]|uniref:Glutamate decarboxylase gad1 n=2 Tax=Entomophthora muscae TaxID=34485 RepID=A0ACC2RRG5_9FUNG|nr:glutamate decarboxylase gad1 [Entomophthora muscae]KAJ9053833.1 glutamate decarboxylase gad1 [Entomophthora muscae]
MSDNGPSKTKATMDSLKGAVQENAGWAIGNEQMQAEGAATRAKADMEYKAAQAEGYAGGVIDSVKGNVKSAVGSAIGNEQMQAEGKASQIKGDVEKKLNS